MQLPNRVHIPSKLERQRSYILQANNKLYAANFDAKLMDQSNVSVVDNISDQDDFCWHNVNLIVDPRLSRSSWQENKSKTHSVFNKRYNKKRAMYVSEVVVDRAYSLVSQCDRSLMEGMLDNAQLILTEVTKCFDGVVGLTLLPTYYGANLGTQVYVCISESHIFVSAYLNQVLSHFSHLYLDSDVSDLRSIILHDMIPVLREYRILDHSERLTVISFDNNEDKDLIAILRDDLNLNAMKVEHAESFEQFIVNTTIHAKHQSNAKIIDYFNQFYLPLLPWFYVNILMVGFIVSYLSFTSYSVYEQQNLRNKWEATYNNVVSNRVTQATDFVAVRSIHSDLLLPNLDKIINVLLINVPRYAWLQSLLVQFDAKKFLVQGWTRTQDSTSESALSIYEFVRSLAETIGITEEEVRVDNTDGQRLIDIMSMKVSSRAKTMSLSPSTNINLNNLDNNRTMAATGFQGSNIASGEKINLLPIKIGNRL